MSGGLAVTVTVQAGGAGARAAAAGLGRWLSSIAPATARGSVGVAIVSSHRIRRLNHRYRGKDSDTDVLSFSSGQPRRLQAGLKTGLKTRDYRPDDGFWGDIAIASGVAARQARDHGHSLRVEFRVLALHGLLHLLGYDHEVDKGLMGRIEDRLRKRGGLPSGLVARARPRPKAASNTRR
jgi:probable rRNA maturation factor